MEARARRLAKRQGLALMKSRRRNTRAVDFGTYVLVDPMTSTLVVGGEVGLSLDEIEAALSEEAVA